MRKSKITPNSTYNYRYVRCDLCRKTAKQGETILSFGDGRYVVHVPCMEEFLLGDAQTVKAHKEAKKMQKEMEIEQEFERIRLLYVQQ